MNQSCINVKLIPNFKFLAEYHKVSEDTLKEIIYKYRSETNNEDAMPTDTYIQAQTGKTQYVDKAPSARKMWESHYKTPKEYSSDAGFQEAKEEALKYFPANAVVMYTNHKGNKVVAVKEPVSKIEPKHRKDFKSWQEYNDYLLTMGDLIPEESRDKEERIVGPQPFTFKDGTTVTVPFRPNSQQEEALNVMNDFINSKETTMTLSGYAGTGKTSLMEIIANKAKKERKHIVFSASTNKAAAVLRDRVKSAGFTAQTLNKVFGIQVEVDQGKPYDANNLVNKLKEADIIPGTIVVIDEASMINEENYKILNGIAKENDLKIIYVGDKGQLAPVKESQVSKVFRNQNGRIVNLTKVERTDDNAILKEATNIRNGEPLSGESSFNEEGKGVAYVKKSNKEAIRNIVERFVPYLKNNPDYFRILAFHNNAVASYNDAVRKALGYNDNTPRVNEPIVGYNNWGYVWDRNGGYYKFINSEAYKVAKVGEPAQRRWTVDGTNIMMQAIPVVLEDAMGNTQTIDFMDIKGNAENRKNALVLAKRKTKLFNDAMKMSKLSPVRANMLREVNAIEEFLFVNDNIEDPDVVNGQGKHPTLQKKVFDFGYAMTVHKSQGSTFTHVMMDDADIATARNTQSSWNTVNIGNDLGEAFDEAPMEVQESGNIFDLINQSSQPATSITPATSTTDNNSINIRQQLEYVAVSRATDTVTVIANDANVKKEDTPLNHVKPSTDNKPSAVPQPVAIENTPKPADQMNRKELWEHLESLAEPMGERPVSYTPKGKARQEYIVKDGKVYNKKGEEVHYQGKDMNKILANLAVAEDRGVVVTYRDNDYVVDNHQNITSVQTGDIMKWGPQDGNRKTIIQLAEQKFKTLIENRQNRLSEIVPELMDLLKAQGINVNDKAAMEKFLKENPQWSTKIQQAIEENREMQDIKARTIADGTFMKAPNSKDTNLTERQWLQVRTKAFKKWFGDWMRFDKANPYSSKISVTNVAPDYDSADAEGPGAMFAIFEGDKYIGSIAINANYKGKNQFKTWGEKGTNYVSMSSVGDAVEIEEEFRGKGYGKAAYFEFAKQMANMGYVLRSAPAKSRTEASTRVWKSLVRDGYAKEAGDRYEFINSSLNNASKAVDENGEPKVVYHGTSRKLNNNSFKSEFIFASDNDIIGAGYGFQRKGFSTGIDYALSNFAGEDINSFKKHIENLIKELEHEIELGEDIPFYQEGDLATKKDLLKELKNAKQEIKSRDIFKEFEFNVFNIFQNVKNPLTVDAKGKYWHSIEFEGTTKNTNEIAKIAKDRGYDGLIITNVIDKGAEVSKNGEYADVANDYIAFEPNQIKSATDNNGMFSTENDDIQAIQTSEGEIYGFADQKGDLYFDEEKVSPNVQIHEYTHLWDRAVAQRNPKLWKRGVDLMKKTSLWNEVLNDSNYGQKWKAVKGMTSEKMESLIASEVHSRLTGAQGEALLNRIAKEKGSKGIVAKLKQWVLDFWKELKSTFSNWSDEEINKLTLDDFTKMTVRDLIDKVNLKTQQSDSNYVVTNEGIRIPMEKGTTIKLPSSLGGTTIIIERIYEDPYEGTKFYGTQYDARGNRISDITEVTSFYNEINGIQVFDASGKDITHTSNQQVIQQEQQSLQQPTLQTQQQAQQPVSFTESTGGYPQRTRENAEWSDITLDLTETNKGSGGANELTKRVAGNKYVHFQLHDSGEIAYDSDEILASIKEAGLPTTGIKLNIAGSEIGKLKHNQEDYNNEVERLIRGLLDLGVTISEIRSGGQTGIDEAGIIAAQRLGIPASVHAPKGFLFRTAEGKDIADRDAFESRFNQASQPVQQPNVQQEQQVNEQEASSLNSVSYPIQMDNLGKETGERMVQVDAEWKSPILLDLDYQLGQTESESEKNNIMQQMQRVKDAISEEDYQKAPTAERQEVNDKMTDYWRRNNQMNALMDNEVNLSASEVREIAEQVVNSISDIITEIQADPEKVKEYFPTLSIKKDLKTATRKEIVQAVNINNLISEAKRRFENIRYDESNQEAYDLYNDSFELMDQADLILDNWETVMELAADVFVINEGFSIKRDTKKQSFETEEREFTGYDYDNYTDPQDEDSIREQEDEQEHWQVEARTIDAFNSMSDQVRLAYHNCYELDRDGNKILDKWGVPKRVNKVKAVAQTLRWTQGALDIHEMVEKLNQKEAKNPWLSQLTRRLIDDTGNEADFQSQFYGVMHRHFQLYSIGQLENGVYASKTLNSHVALSEVMKGITAQFQLKGHPLFDVDGTVKPDSLKQLKNWHKELGSLVNKYNIKFSNGKYTSNDAISDADVEIAAKNISAVSRMFGYSVSEESVKNIIAEDSLHKMWSKLGFAIDNLDKAGKGYDPFNFEADNNIRSEVMGFLTPIVEELEDAATNAFFDNGKMYQSYVIPSFLTQLFDQFKQSPERVYQWMEEFYGQSEWFKDKDGNWRLEWLDLMSRDPKARETFDHKVQLNFNKHDYMRNMSPEEFTLSVFMEYFTERLNMKDLEHTPAWFRVPIQSNKPSSEFIKFYTDRSPAYKDNIVSKVYGMFLQELSRIDTVRKRNKKEGDPEFIASFDENGRKFQFLPFLNPYLEDNNSELGKLLQKKLKAEVESKLSEAEEGRLMTLVQEETRSFMQQRADSILQRWEDTGILKAAEKIKGIKSLNHSVRENLENFLWNDFFAANSILQLTIVDKAFYPHATELQKRLAELHAPGTRGNKYATDYNGKRVSDGFYRTLLIKDLDGFTASIIENIDAIFKRKIEAAPESEKPAWEALRESLVGENGAYRRINVTDGQAYSSPSSYRKKAFMFGKWSKKAEDIYQRLLKGDFSISDLEVAFQPLKPFVYGHLSKDMGVDKAPITKMPVPFQAKNSEYLLIMADALMRGQETGRPNLLKAIFDVMEESHYDAGHYGEENHYREDGIDTVQFDSAIKSGNQAVVDITPFLNMPGGEAGAYTLMKNAIFQENVAEDGSKYNYTYVHKTDYDNYALQQEVPAHFKEHQQAEGSQQRMNIPTDLDFYDYNGEVNNYSWKDPDGTEHKMNAKEFRHEYERVHAANIEDSFNTLAKELHLNSTDKKARNLALSEILQEEIISSPRYGLDLFLACQIDPATGEFRIPKGDPIQGKRIEQLINSIIKNRVNKQKIAGGPIVQVTNFGTSKQLHIRFNDKNGGLLLTKEEYEKSIQEQPTSQTDKFNAKYGKKTGSTGKSYEEYVKENQAGVAHFEIFAPIGMQKLFEKFKNADGTINLEAVERCDPELLKVITGRIPNEDKYSIAHGKIVGFMPALAGDAIMFPAELTEIDDSDFDVDKRYTMRKVMDIVEDTDKIRKSLYNRVINSYKNAHNGEISYNKKRELNDAVNMLLDDPERMKNTDALMASLYQEYQKILREEYPYKTRYPKKGTRDANNNQIIDMSWAVMSNEMTADKILNPGGFEIPKHTAYVIAAYRNSDGTISWEKLEGMTTKQLQKLASKERDLAWFDDHVQFYKQNAAGSNLIGVFAVNKVAHATLEGDGLLINIEDFCGEKPFTICDTEFKGMMPVDDAEDSNGQRIGKNIGSGIGASADTAKDPWLDSININMTTAGMYNMLLRIGMPMADAELFMAQDVISRMLGEFNRKSLENKGTTLDKIIQERIDTIKGKYKYTEDSEINTQPLTREELKKGLIAIRGNATQERDAIEYKTLLAFQKLKTLAKAIRKPTLITRLNSISSAVGPLIIDNIILEHKLNEFLQIEDEDNTGFYTKNPDGTYSPVDMDDILANHPILKQFSRPIDSRNPDCPTRIMFSDMPTGSNLFKSVLKALPSNIDAKIYDDRQLLNKLSDFFQSYLLVANNVIKPEQLKYYIEEFPKEFSGVGKSSSIKEQHPDNAFVQAIQLNYEKKSNRAFLNINTTGMKEQEKERLRMAWTDLHRVDPELSTKLFTYAFFRGGIGFSPKTFMGLVPTYVKEHLTDYVDTYRHFPKVLEDVVIEQFVRNNWDNSTLVPRKGGENTKYEIDLDNGTLIVRDEKDKKDLAGIRFMKTVQDKETYLWKLLGTEDTNKKERYYVRIYPLGNNGEYVEMSTVKDMTAMSKTTELKDNNEATQLPETSPTETDAAEVDTPTQMPESNSQQSKTLADLVPTVMRRDSSKSPKSAMEHLEKYKSKALNNTLQKGEKAYLVNLFNDLGLKLTPEEAVAKFKEFC